MFAKKKKGGGITTSKMTLDQTHSNIKQDARIFFLQTARKWNSRNIWSDHPGYGLLKKTTSLGQINSTWNSYTANALPCANHKAHQVMTQGSTSVNTDKRQNGTACLTYSNDSIINGFIELINLVESKWPNTRRIRIHFSDCIPAPQKQVGEWNPVVPRVIDVFVAAMSE